MSTTPSVPFPFEAEIGALGCTSGQNQTPKHLKIDFEARFYPLPEATTGQQSPSGGSGRSFSSSYVAQSSMPSPPPSAAAAGPTMSAATTQAPYVGTINLESHYSSVLASCLDPSSSQQAAPPAVPVFPGYAVPRRGQIQLLIKNPHLNVPVKLFLVPYDLSDMPAGSKTFLRQKICLEAGSEASSSPPMTTGRAKRHSLGATTSLLRSEAKPKEMLRYAVHLQFASPPLKPASKKQQSAKQAAASAQTLESSSWQAGPEQEEPKLYLHKSIRIVFSPRAPDREEKVKTTYETPAGLCVPELPAQDPKECARMREKKYAPYSGPSAEWEGQRKRARLARREWKRRRQSEVSERDREQGDESVGSFADQSDISTASSVPATEGYGRFEPAGEAVEAAAMAMDIDVEPDVQAQANVFEPNSDPNGERWHGSQAIGVDEAEDVAGTGTLADRWESLTLASRAEPGATSTPGWPLRGHRHTLQRQRSRTITPATQANAEGRASPLTISGRDASPYRPIRSLPGTAGGPPSFTINNATTPISPTAPFSPPLTPTGTIALEPVTTTESVSGVQSSPLSSHYHQRNGANERFSYLLPGANSSGGSLPGSHGAVGGSGARPASPTTPFLGATGRSDSYGRGQGSRLSATAAHRTNLPPWRRTAPDSDVTASEEQGPSDPAEDVSAPSEMEDENEDSAHQLLQTWHSQLRRPHHVRTSSAATGVSDGSAGGRKSPALMRRMGSANGSGLGGAAGPVGGQDQQRR